MAELRAYSTRARITPTSFVNDYAWGGFKGNADAWMERYSDAFLYLANSGTHVLKLRLPSRLLDPESARAYCGGQSASVVEKSGKVILSFLSHDEEGGEWVEGDGRLSSLIAVRAELACRDLRALYLGWLLRAQSSELDDEDREPPVPPGLGQLSASLRGLAEFLRIDGDLLQVAAQASAPLQDLRSRRDEVQAWVATLPTPEKDDLIASLIVDADRARVAELTQRFLEGRRGGSTADSVTRRTVGELRHTAEAYAEVRRRIELEKQTREKTRRQREAAAAHVLRRGAERSTCRPPARRRL